MVRSVTHYDLSFLKMGSQMHASWCRISNGSISANGYPIHFMFRSRVVFSIKPTMVAMTWYDMVEDIGKSQAMSLSGSRKSNECFNVYLLKEK